MASRNDPREKEHYEQAADILGIPCMARWRFIVLEEDTRRAVAHMGKTLQQLSYSVLPIWESRRHSLGPTSLLVPRW
jgi:hypothetical protein